MSTTLQLRFIITETVGGSGRIWAQPAVAPTLEVDSVNDYYVPVAAGDTEILWAPTDANGPSLAVDFQFLMLTTDKAVKVEFTCANGTSTERVFAVTLGPDWPLILADDAAYFNFVAGPAGDAFAGTLGVINHLRAKNLSGTEDALVRVTIGATAA